MNISDAKSPLPSSAKIEIPLESMHEWLARGHKTQAGAEAGIPPPSWPST
ncbi:predicted protein [Botrytis cinerea T4]|uniref:Uncharacterized protein n=1 Tax=Botryotinia fuckeliana (strain T4) TaxID=999810 RepID=G2YRQ7_BOTF4|nr:predicted protein [Botrytis cinerea T4]